ncbi:MAG: glycosyltransferase family 2 protein [Lachnospiraceae bacterium]|jgi:glycosyltransferase involved in cell wall biosynthesis|nr:glycosyltransferase family 2 protein [Lachnospiraceae bacterium]
MEGNDLVSIVVPVYNSEAYLERCIRSLRLQSYENLEMILVDDGSTDGSLEICSREASEDKRIQVIHKKNGGAASARNAGLDRITGQWLLLIDGDDYIHKDMVRELLNSAKSCHAQTAICGFSRVYEDQRRPEVHALSGKAGRQDVWQGTLHRFSEELFLPLYENLMLRTQSNKLYWVPLIQEHQLRYPEGISINEDIWFCVRYLTFCKRIACIPGSYLYYWQDPSQRSLIGRYHPEGVESCFLLLKAIEEFMKTAKSSPMVRNRMDQEMLFHICGFAGHSYYRTLKPLSECYQEIKKLAGREELQALIRRIAFFGFEKNRLKNQAAAFLLGHDLCRLYHWLCLGVYGRQRQALKREKRKDRANGAENNMMKREKASDEILVSISCITFNHETYIARALDSFLMQKTNFNFEILVYDDASTDRTQEIIREYEAKYPDRIKPYYQKENQYSQGKYNVEGFFNYPRAKGTYIAMCDGDDYWTDPNKLQLQVDYMEAHPECAMCLHSAKIETQEKAIQSLEIRPYRKNRLILPGEVIDKASNYPTASLLFRTEYTRDLKDYYYVSPVGDIPIQLHMAAKGTVYYMDRKMSVYQQGVSVSWSALMKQGNYKQNLIDHHNAMKIMYRGFSKETGGIYDGAIQRALRRMDFLTYLNVKEYKKVLAPGYRSFYKELDFRTRFFIRFEMTAPWLYRFLRKLVFGKDRC